MSVFAHIHTHTFPCYCAHQKERFPVPLSFPSASVLYSVTADGPGCYPLNNREKCTAAFCSVTAVALVQTAPQHWLIKWNWTPSSDCAECFYFFITLYENITKFPFASGTYIGKIWQRCGGWWCSYACTDMQVLGPVQVYFCASMLDTGQKRLKCRNNSTDPKKGFDQLSSFLCWSISYWNRKLSGHIKGLVLFLTSQ